MKEVRSYHHDSENRDERKRKELSNLQDVIKVIGDGWGQIIVVTCVCFATIASTINGYLMYFLTLDKDWKCDLIHRSACNFTDSVSVGSPRYKLRCQMPKEHWKYVTPAENSLVTTFDLACDRNHWIYTSMTVAAAGNILGCFVIGYLSDRFGRQHIVRFTFLLQLAVNLFSALSNSIQLFAAFRFFLGFIGNGTIRIGFLLVTEIVSHKWEAWTGFMVWLFFAFGQMLTGVFAKYIRDWKKLIVVCNAPFLLFIPPLYFLPESLDWLLSKSKEKELQSAMKVYSRYNKKNVKIDTDTIYTIRDRKEEKESFKDGLKLMFGTVRKLCMTLILCSAWFTIVIIYSGINNVSDVITDNAYRNFIILAAIEVPAAPICMLLSRYFTMKGVTWTTLLLGGGSLVIVGFLLGDDDLKIARLLLSVFSKFTTTIAFNCLIIWGVLLYPAKIRASCLGVFGITANLGSLLTPWLSLWLQHFGLQYPFFVMGGAPCFAALLLILVPAKIEDHVTVVVKETIVLENPTADSSSSRKDLFVPAKNDNHVTTVSMETIVLESKMAVDPDVI